MCRRARPSRSTSNSIRRNVLSQSPAIWPPHWPGPRGRGKCRAAGAGPASAIRRAASACFDALSYSKQRAHVIAVESAKRPETRARRVEKIAGELSA
nr:YdeI/OmpD-associated family protein [Nocardia flavorosea]